MSERRVGAPVGELLDSLGVRLRMADHQQLVEVLLIGKMVDFNGHGSTSLVIGTSEGLDWLGQRGLLGAAQDVLTADILRGADD